MGYPLKVVESPRFFNNAFKMEQVNAVYVPFPVDSISSFMQLAEEIGVSGLSIKAPFKQEILPYLAYKSDEVVSIGACNTVVKGPQGWMGYNTEALSFSSSLLSFTGRKDFRRQKVAIIGAGGGAKAVASEVYRLKGKALILNRTIARARSLAEPYRFAWAGFDGRGAELMEKYSDIIIQTSHVGMDPYADEDPLEFYKFTGRETVMDLIYKPGKTIFLERAEKAGCRILSGSDMFNRQACSQYNYFINKEFPSSLISRVGL
jgi:3-dehydroquinate dehydratase/shikimate dehydrogenase